MCKTIFLTMNKGDFMEETSSKHSCGTVDWITDIHVYQNSFPTVAKPHAAAKYRDAAHNICVYPACAACAMQFFSIQAARAMQSGGNVHESCGCMRTILFLFCRSDVWGVEIT